MFDFFTFFITGVVHEGCQEKIPVFLPPPTCLLLFICSLPPFLLCGRPHLALDTRTALWSGSVVAYSA